LQGTKVEGLKNEEELRKKVEQLQAELEARKRQLELPWNVFHSVKKKGPALISRLCCLCRAGSSEEALQACIRSDGQWDFSQ